MARITGIIEREYFSANGNCINSVIIAGDDGVVYFGHHADFNRKSKHYRKGRRVTFEPLDEGRAHINAKNIDVEVPARPDKEEELVGITHLRDGAYVKRIRKATGAEVSLIIKDGRLVISCLPEYERDMIWMYQRGPSGRPREWEEMGA